MSLPDSRLRRRLRIAALGLLAAGCAETEGAIDRHAPTVAASMGASAIGVTAGELMSSVGAEAGLGAAGAIVGLAAAPYLAKRDTVFFDKAIDIAAESKPGTPIHWNNPNTGTTGVMTRGADVDLFIDQTCRKLRSEETKDGEIEVENMVVCKPDLGTWFIHSSWLEERRPVPAKKPAGS